MSGISFLSPGVRVMRRLRLGGKLVVLAAAAVAPLLLWWGLSRWPLVAGWAPWAALGGLAVALFLPHVVADHCADARHAQCDQSDLQFSQLH